MNTSDLLEQLLRASRGSATQHNAGAAGQGGLGGLLGGLLGGAPLGAGGAQGGASGGLGGLGGLLGGLLGGGAQAGGGVRGGQAQAGGRNYAMLASLGMMAFQAYQAWQRQQAAAPQQPPTTVDQLAGPEADDHSHAILRALIAAAKADGRIDEQEQQLIQKELAQHTDDPDLQQWLDAEVAKPLDAREVASVALGEPGMAAEMYLASVLLVGAQQGGERDYLDELAGALNIDPQLQVHLEQQASGAAT